MGKTRDLFKKIRYTKRPFHAKMGTVMNRNGMDLTECGPLEKGMAKHFNILALRIPGTV